jgi:hypothetical protein
VPRGLSDRPSITPVMHGTDGPLAPTGAAGLDHPLRPADRLAMAFLMAYREDNTRHAYKRDLADWWRWCASQDLDPLQARRVHVDAYARTLE